METSNKDTMEKKDIASVIAKELHEAHPEDVLMAFDDFEYLMLQ